MSYILDALKRADAEREREHAVVPGLHALSISMDDDERPRSGHPTWWLAAGVASILMLAGALWAWWPRESTPKPAAQAVDTAALTSPPAQPPVPIQTPAPPTTAVLPPLPTLPQETAHLQTAQPKTEIPVKPKPKVIVPASPDQPASQRVYQFGELPENIRQELPSLSLNSAMYAKQAASRMVVVNGQVFHEGDTLAPHVVLIQIKPKEIVLDYKGYHYAVKY